jgi:penicillin amidase
MKRWITRLFAGTVFLALVGVILAWTTLRGSLPQLDGAVEVPGLAARATIERDASGIPTITASTRSDLAFATGFAHGQDRFFQMDLIRRRGAGELSALFGPLALDVDRRYRFHRFRERARERLAALSPTEREILGSYADGANAGLASLSVKPFEYLFLKAEPEPWRPEDTVLVTYTMFMMLNDSRGARDLRRGLVQRLLPADAYAWLYPQGTDWDAPMMGEPRTALPIPAPETYSVREYVDESAPAAEEGKQPLNGSNNWAVAGELTATGRAIVSNDMHLGLAAPNIYYQARLVVPGDPGRDVTGVTLPGAPFVVAGSNTRVAWGYTNSYGDWTDAVLIRPGDEPGSYRAPEGDRRFAEHRELIEVKGAEPIEMVVRETVWGPVNEDANYPDGEIAVSWIAHKPDAVNLRILDLEQADSVDAALDIANSMGLPPQNFVVGDAAGNIGWTIAGRIPVRTEFDATLPADWSYAHGWAGWLDGSRYPRIVNPVGGRIWTANARVADGDALAVIGDGGYDLGARARQIRDGLFARELFTPEDMLEIQYDDRALFLARWRDLLLGVLDEDRVAADARLDEYRRLVDDWIPRAVPESTGYRLVRAFRLEVQARIFHGLTAPVRAEYGNGVKLRLSNQFEAPMWALLTQRPLHLLPGNYDSWDDLLVSAVLATIRHFEDNYPGPLVDRTWGELNTASIRHPMSPAMPWLARLLDMPREPLNGDVDLPKAQGPRFGASERFSVSPGDEANGVMHMPTGQSGHPLSPFYRSGHDDWVRGRPSPFLPGPAQHRLILEPAS